MYDDILVVEAARVFQMFDNGFVGIFDISALEIGGFFIKTAGFI